MLLPCPSISLDYLMMVSEDLTAFMLSDLGVVCETEPKKMWVGLDSFFLMSVDIKFVLTQRIQKVQKSVLGKVFPLQDGNFLSVLIQCSKVPHT